MALTRGTIGRRRGQIDDPANAMANCRAEYRDLSHHGVLEDARGSSPLEVRSRSDRRAKYDRIAAVGDKGFDPFRVRDIALNSTERFAMFGQGLLRLRQAVRAV